ncbi:hypothetical protein BDD12DRAFT_944862 [Trichophaea hybrida]|nr:hypothetical protein BDD12DRAFT_944862 [Trichophaea hybrida]
MEHLPTPKDANVTPIDIPYACRTDYDRGPFLSYPSRRGWKLQPDGSLDLLPMPSWFRNPQETGSDGPTFAETAAAQRLDADNYDGDYGPRFINMDDFDDDDGDDEDDTIDVDADDEEDGGADGADDDDDEDDDDDDYEELDCFIQTWLFFGCLIEIFGIVGIHVRESDFIRDNKYITTAKLPRLIEEWEAREESSSEGNSLLSVGHTERHAEWEGRAKTKAGRYLMIIEVLEKVQSVVKKHCYGEIGPYGPNPPGWGVEPKISLSIMALGCSLKNAASSIYDPNMPRTRQLWGTSDILTGRFDNGGWCDGELNALMNTVEIDGIYYFGSLQSPRALSKENHNDCSLQACVSTIDTTSYETRHAKKCLDCKCLMFGDPVAVAAIVEEKAIPLVLWTGSELKVVKYDSESKQKYLAISHVWSDGMGNQKDNKLPQCQLESIHNMINSLYSEQRQGQHEEHLSDPQQPVEQSTDLDKSVGFWMDTLCIPVSESPQLASDRAQNLRKDAIAKMRYIYETAHEVLVIDSWIRELSRSASIIEKATRIFLSNWQHRLWTLQEGVLAQRLFSNLRTDHRALNSSDANKKEGAEEKSLAAKVLPILEVVTRRKTSRLTDETICIATLLNFDEETIRKNLDLRSPGERMRAFLKILGAFHQDIIFSEFPKLQTPGFRWAPHSFLNQEGSLWPESTTELSERERSDHFGVLASSGGLHVTFTGIKLRAVKENTERLMCVVPYHDEQNMYGVLLMEKLTNWSPENHYGIISSAPIHGAVGTLHVYSGA